MTSLSVDVVYFRDDLKLVKDKSLAENPVFILKTFNGDQWKSLKQWSDIGHVASLLIKTGYQSEHLPAIKILSIL